MNEENNRIKELRKALDLNQEDFGDAIGLTKSSISNVEKGVRNVTEQHIKLITTAFNVNEHWLRTGEGEMFIENDSTIITELANEYRLDDLDKKIIEHYVKLDSEHRKTIKNYVLSLAAQLNGLVETAATTEKDEIEAELENYRHELEAEKKVQTLSASQEQRETS
ncbi:helix-turn-helix transcriptional regulator [Lysinibacillus sp. KU-BSD001]|uniref:helix-turn-helix domain-containing protein n=1 Tax=Lysinibacillus sp. KU-BSD001 TaxID=3141328 RepID=UPI0036E8D0CE